MISTLNIVCMGIHDITTYCPSSFKYFYVKKTNNQYTIHNTQYTRVQIEIRVFVIK